MLCDVQITWHIEVKQSLKRASFHLTCKPRSPGNPGNLCLQWLVLIKMIQVQNDILIFTDKDAEFTA